MTPHIDAKVGDIAPNILLPGDPLRAKWIAENFLDNPVCYNKVRNMLGFTGTYKGTPISVQGTGMGQPSISIYVHELLNIYGVKNLIRVGSAGGMSDKVKIGDVILAMTASTDSGINRSMFDGMDYAPCANWALLSAAAKAMAGSSKPVHVGGIFSGDLFYADRENYLEKMIKHGILGVEMEANALYTLAARFNARALGIMTVSDHLTLGHEHDMSPEERETGLKDMITIALEALVEVAG